MAVGAVLYGVLRLSYVFFYLQVRATPEEVGYGYAEVLASQLIGALWLVALMSISLTALIWLTRLAWVHLSSRSSMNHRTAAFRSRPLAALRRVGAYSIALSVLVVLIVLPAIAWTTGSHAAQGQTVRNVYLLGATRLPILAVQAVPAHLVAIEESAAGRFLESRSCLLYLGRAEGTAVFYDVATAESLRVPTSEIIISLDYTLAVPEGC